MIALTGASGFLGRHIAEILAFKKNPHTCLIRKGSRRAELLRQITPNIHEVDFQNSRDLREALRHCKVLIHALGLINGSEEELERVNVTYAKNIFAAAGAENLEKVILISSVASLRRHGFYGETKFQAEEALLAAGIPYTIFRPAYIYGRGDENNTALMLRTLRRLPIVPVLGGGNFKLQPVYVGDVVDLILQAVELPAKNKGYNVAGPEQIALLEMLKHLSKGLGVRRIFIPIPLKPIQAFLRLFLKIVPNPKIPAKQILELDKHEAFDISQTSTEFKFRPMTFDLGCQKMFSGSLCAV